MKPSTRNLLADGAALSDAVCASRPQADPTVEQFLMQSGSVEYQARFLSETFQHSRILLLGDDDHVSIVLAAFSDAHVTVVELDSRVCSNLTAWRDSLGLDNLSVVNADILGDFDLPRQDAFYVNPPFSSKNAGHGLKIWVDVALTYCDPHCQGVIAMPSSPDLSWVNRNWLILQDFITGNGMRIMSTGETHTQAYIDTNDVGLRSQNLYVRRVDTGLRRHEDRRGNLYR